MHKILKIILVVFAVLIVVGVGSISLIVFDAAGSFATDVHPLPNGAPIGQAIIVYDPGLSGKAKDVATNIGYDLQERGFNVVLAGVKSSAAQNLTGYDLIVVGGPIYMGKAAASIEAYFKTLNPPANATVGAFGYGSMQSDGNQTAINAEVAPLPADSHVTLGPAIKISQSDDITSKCHEFVARFGVG
jgi:flavodoxin